MVEQTRSKSRGRRPVSRHPLFAPILGLWGAALFGLACLAFKPAPLFALVVAVLGGGLGLLLARLLAGPRASARDSEDQERTGAAAAVAETPEPSPEQSLWDELKGSRRALAGQESLGDAAEEPETQPASFALMPTDEPRILDLEAIEVPAQPLAEAPAGPACAAQPASAAERIAGDDLDGLSHVELLERLALSLQRRNPRIPPLGEPRPAFEAAEAARPDVAVQAPPAEVAIVFPARAQRREAAGLPGEESVVPPVRTVAVDRPVEDTEQALRAALAALQRMSGAA